MARLAARLRGGGDLRDRYPPSSVATFATAARCAGGSSAETSGRGARAVAAEPSMEGADLAREVTPAEPIEIAGDGPMWSASTLGSSTPSSVSSRSAVADHAAPLRPLGGGGTPHESRSDLPGEWSRRPRRARLRGRERSGWSARSRWSASASVISCSAARSDSRPSAPSATAAPSAVKDLGTGRIDITSRSTFRGRGPDGAGKIDGDEPVRWETDFRRGRALPPQSLRPDRRGPRPQGRPRLHRPVPRKPARATTPATSSTASGARAMTTDTASAVEAGHVWEGRHLESLLVGSADASGRRRSSTTPACRPARCCWRRATRSSPSTRTRRRS